MKNLRRASDALLVLSVVLLGVALFTDGGWVVILAAVAMASSIGVTLVKRRIVKQRRVSKV